MLAGYVPPIHPPVIPYIPRQAPTGSSGIEIVAPAWVAVLIVLSPFIIAGAFFLFMCIGDAAARRRR